MKKQLLVFIAIIGGVFFLTYCGNIDKSNTENVLASTDFPASPPESIDTFQAVDMPSVLANGEVFPLDSTIIQGWVSKSNPDDRGHEQNPNIIEHGWAIWAALTEVLHTDSTRVNGADSLRSMRRYETWYTPQDVMDAIDNNIPLKDLDRDRGTLDPRKTFAHNIRVGGVVGKSKYNPVTADYIFENRLLDSNLTTLKEMVKPNEITRLVLPDESVIIKPAHWVLTDQHKATVKGKEDWYKLPLWGGDVFGGTPVTEYPEARKGSFIYVSTKNDDTACTAQDTCFSINSFIHHEIDNVEAYFFNRVMRMAEDEFNPKTDTAKAGDIMLLIAMHAATREIAKWTWQSFFWSPNPDNPISPSSATIAAGKKALKPNSLDANASHYAMTVAYNMVVPAQGDDYASNFNVANVQSIYAQNPYIEGPFTRAVFKQQEGLFKTHYPNEFDKYFIKTNVDGVTSNCMSCHSQASLIPNNPSYKGGLGFVADQYVSRDAKWFKGTVQTDFVWSLSGCCEKEPDGSGENRN